MRRGDNLSAISLRASPRTRSDWWREASALRRKLFPQMIMRIDDEKHFFHKRNIFSPSWSPVVMVDIRVRPLPGRELVEPATGVS